MPSSNNEKDLLHEALKRLSNKDKTPFFDKEVWDQDQKDIRGAIENYEHEKRSDLADRPLYVASGLNLIKFLEPFASDSYFHDGKHKLYYRETFGTVTVFYDGPKDKARISFQESVSPSFNSQMEKAVSVIYEKVKPSFLQKTRKMLTG